MFNRNPFPDLGPHVQIDQYFKVMRIYWAVNTLKRITLSPDAEKKLLDRSDHLIISVQLEL